jgi:hypothetical protein
MTSIQTAPIPHPRSKNAIIARNGFRAECVICTQVDIKQALEEFFNMPIKHIYRIHREKYDIEIIFENGTKTTIQNKDGGTVIRGRGWSVDRRHVSQYGDMLLSELLSTLCLKKGTQRPIITATTSAAVIAMCIIGNTPRKSPEYFSHTISDKPTGRIIQMSICPTNTLLTFIHTTIYATMIPKRTCVHLSPDIYLQRKGGHKKENKPDDIQMKFILSPGMRALFTPVVLAKTTLQLPPQM